MPFWKCFSCLRFPADDCITQLDYSNGTLTDIPPDVSQFERTLEELYLSSNRITDMPPELFYCQELRVLKLNDNELETIPSAIGSLRQLQTLDLSRNSLSNIPDNLKSCKYLTHLDLSLNNLQRLPDALTNLITLQELLLNETFLEFLPANFGRLVNLRILELRSNNLLTLPKSMSRLVELQRIDIGGNEFTELPEVIGHLTKLRELWIDSNRIRRISPNIANLRELIHFEVTNNQLTNLPNEISSWRNLEVLALSLNDLETLPFSLGMLKRLVTLKCDSNQLKELPDSICHLDQLEEIVVSHNYLIRLPNTIGLLRRLKFLLADENMLRKLPNEICSCAGLSVLSLRGNKLTELPHDIGHLKTLRVLNIVDNQMAVLPVSVLNLTNLSALWLSDNQSQPLVPLQYADNANKSALTCFMLPQMSGRAASDLRTEKINDENEQWYRLADGTSPSRKICFADETSSKPTEAITTRLMRSPTPYPKELRLMAKFTNRNQIHYQHQNNGFSQPVIESNGNDAATDNTDTERPASTKSSPTRNVGPYIKEARVLHNSQMVSNGSSTQPTINHTMLFLTPSPTSTPLLLSDCDNLTNTQQNNLIDGGAPVVTPSSNVDPVQSTDSSHDYNDLQYCNSAEQFTHHPQQLSNYYDPFTGSLKLRSSADSGDYVDYAIVQRTAAAQWTISRNADHSASNFSSAGFYQPQSRYSQSATVPLAHPRPQPPPYHIAKAYTKKSREDLLTYDSIRHRNSSVEFLNGSNGGRSNSRQLQHPLLPSPFDGNFNSTDEFADTVSISSSRVNQMNNNQEISDEKFRYNAHDPEMLANGNHEDTCNNVQENNVQENNQVDCNTESNSPTNTSESMLKSRPWLFGPHRNPTVKQFTLRKDPTLGFEIKEIDNQGIFVSIISSNTQAEELLRIDDKILDIDGNDFSKINYHDAQKILIDSGPLVNIMISRT